MIDPQAPWYYQNNVAALKVLGLLDFGSLINNVTLDNYDKGNHIDDVIIEYRSGLTRYYQVKWSNDEEKSYTLYNMMETHSQQKNKSLFQELAEGYLSLENKNDVEIILHTRREVGNNRRLSKGIDKGLEDFINDIHTPFINSDVSQVSQLPKYTDYQNVIGKIKQATCITDEETFSSFLKRLRFEFNQPDLETQQQKVYNKLERLGIDKSKYSRLIDQIVNWSISHENNTREAITADKLRRELGIADRFIDSVNHEFYVNEDYYIENSSVFDCLDEAVNQLSSGFILLEGPPGSGKSTALTVYKQRNKNIKFAYYCFNPDEKSLGNERMEKDTFIKSLCIGIQNSSPDIEFPQMYSGNYEVKLRKWLDILSEKKEKIVFVIDGLDHVDRKNKEGLLEQPLTNHIDNSLPENIIFILSSQYPDALSHSVQAQIKQNSLRHIKMQNFTEGEVELYLQKRKIETNPYIISLIIKKVEGLPLYLYYITNLIAEISTDKIIKVLEELPQINQIDTYHRILYNSISQNSLAVWSLAILALRSEYTTTTILVGILKIINVSSDFYQVEEAISKFKHLLKRMDGDAYAIYHNSFREFILNNMAENLLPRINEALVKYYETKPEDDETYRNFFRHLFHINQYQKILNYCNEDWLRKCWRDFRPFDEINKNLDLSWESAIKICSLQEYVRIAFLKQQFGVILHNVDEFQNYNDKFLLSIGREREALRKIWDGERVACSRNKFCNFVLDYIECTGNDLPEKIIISGFSKLKEKSNVDETTLYFKARALYENWQELYDEIDQHQWQTSDEYNHVSQKADESENEKINEKVKFKMLDSLFLNKKYGNLIEIGKSNEVSPLIRNQSIIFAIKLFICSEELDEAVNLIDLLDFRFISRRQYNDLLIMSFENGCFYKVEEHILFDYIPSKLFTKLTKQDHDYGMKDGVFRLYDSFRTYFLQNPNGYNLYCLRANNYGKPENAFFLAIIELAWLWYKTIKKEVSETEKTQKVKIVLQYLNVDKQEISFEDRGNDPGYISRSISRIYVDIFNYISNCLDIASMIEIVDYWLILDKSPNGYKNQKISIEFAKLLSKLNNKSIESSIIKLLKRAEEQARFDEETSVLVGNLVECIEAYGYCGFHSDTMRIWEELYGLACGIYYRKDYQFTEIIPLLDLVHKEHPEKSKERLAKLLALAYQLEEAARGKTQEIAIEKLIKFSIKISPELALELLYREDKTIYRERAIHDLTEALAELPNINLWYVWAIIKTMDKWSNYTQYDEETYPTILYLLEKAGEAKQKDLLEDIYSFAKRQLLVEKNMPERVYEMAEKCLQSGVELECIITDHEEFVRYKKSNKTDDPFTPKMRQERINIPDARILEELALSNFAEFESIIEDLHCKFLREDRKEQLKRNYDLKRIFTKVYESLEPDEAEVIKDRNKQLNRKYFELSNDILELQNIDDYCYNIAVTELFSKFISDIENIITPKMTKTIKDLFNYEGFLAEFIKQTKGSDYWFGNCVLNPNINRFIEKEHFINLKKWEEFCKKWLFGDNLGRSLQVLAKRFKKLDPEHCKALLIQAWKANKEFFYSGNRASEALRLLFEVDPENAKEILLYSFYEQYKVYSSGLIYNLDSVIEFSEYFREQDIHENIYNYYENYIELLAEGLSEKEVDFSWVKDFMPSIGFEDAIVKYLIRLIDYPQIEIRKLSMNSLNSLMLLDSGIILKILDFSAIESENIKEHVLNLFFTVSLIDPKLVTEQKKMIFQFLEMPHFNIKQTVKELLLYCQKQGEMFEPWELDKLKSVNIAPKLILPAIEANLKKGRRFIPSRYQSDLMYKMHKHNNNDDLMDKVYTYILNLGWDIKIGMDMEGATHRKHNINTNYDLIEINGAYFNIVQKALNEVFAQEIRNQNYEDIDIEKIQNYFRLYDPAIIFNKVYKKPSNINWINSKIIDEEYLAFGDLSECFSEFTERDNEWLTIYEDGHQRIGEKFGGSKRTTYFKLIAFMISSQESKHIKQPQDSRIAPFCFMENCYTFEIPNVFPKSDDFPITEVRPLVGISENNFRGNNDLSIAAILPDLIEELQLSRESQTSLNYCRDGNVCVEFLRWQEEFDQDRRRQKPKSAGVFLKIRKDILQAYLDNSGYKLCYSILLRRSTDKYKSEEDMQWTHYEDMIFL